VRARGEREAWTAWVAGKVALRQRGHPGYGQKGEGGIRRKERE